LSPVPERIAVVGVSGGEPVGKEARAAVEAAMVVAGAPRHLRTLASLGARTLPIDGPLTDVLDAIERERGGVCVLASGDPGFFGIVRVLAERFGPERLDVHPAPSSVSLAFARLGLPWDDAAVISAHGRPLADAARRAVRHQKAAVLVAPDAPPEALGRELRALGAPHRRAAVCSRLGEPDERVDVFTLEQLTAGSFDPMSVVVLLDGDEVAATPTLEWGRSEQRFAVRDGLVTKAEARAVALGKLAIPTAGVIWDVGAGSGSVAIEVAALASHARVIAVERHAEDVRRIEANATEHGVTIEVVHGEAPGALEPLPDPDRVFVGGGGTAVLDAVLARLRPGGRVVATFAVLDRAAAAYERLGNLAEVSVARGRPLAGGVRLQAENPVFVVWGPES
jgi:precorrin-6B C5,15-methyltransferase / cobalt-precorrin-6B C5,C15-methyltransferase